VNIRDPRAQKLIFGALMLAGLFYVYFGLSVLPFGYQARADEIGQLKSEYAKLSSEVNQARRLAADLPRVEALHAATQKKWEVANELLPTGTEMAGLLRKMTMVGFTSGVEFVKFEPMNSTNYEYYAENPVEVTVVGSYHNVGTFFSEISAMSRLVTVRMLKLVSLTGGEDDETVSATFSASAYSVSGSHVRANQSTMARRTSGNRSGPPARPARIEE
jgi:type IV pilus assembly protein PilO